jgi:hypothetical protein
MRLSETGEAYRQNPKQLFMPLQRLRYGLYRRAEAQLGIDQLLFDGNPPDAVRGGVLDRFSLRSLGYLVARLTHNNPPAGSALC